MIRNVILDWSGTVVDDLPAVVDATNHVLVQAGLPALSEDQFRREFVLPVAEFYTRVLPGRDPAQLEAWFHERFPQVQHRVVALPWARGFLEFCARHALRVFALTSVPDAYFHLQARELGFAGFLESAWTGVADKRLAMVELLAKERLEPRETLMVGDMRHDLDAARAGGVWCCAVLSGYQALDQLRSADPDLVVEHVGELQRVLEAAQLDLDWIKKPRARQPVGTVGAAIFNAAGQVLVVRTRKWSNLWGIPGGKIKYGEAAEGALRREILEETGLEIAAIEFVMVQDCIESTEFYRREHFLLLNYACRCPAGAAVQLNEEAQAYEWLTLPEALGRALNRPTRILFEALLRRETRAASNAEAGHE